MANIAFLHTQCKAAPPSAHTANGCVWEQLDAETRGAVRTELTHQASLAMTCGPSVSLSVCLSACSRNLNPGFVQQISRQTLREVRG